jgi:hypothetical protein
VRAVVLAALFALTLAASAEPSTVTGLRGHVTIGPLQPVCRVGTPCVGPARHVSLSFVRSGLRTQTRTDANGYYRIALAAGRYAVHPGKGLAIRPASVLSVRGRMRVVNLAIDTGIR